MRVSSLIAGVASIGAAMAATPIKGPFEIQAVAINDTKSVWVTNIGVVSRGAVILSLAKDKPAQFTWSDDTGLVPVGDDSSLHGSIGDKGTTLLFVGPDGPQPPGPADYPLEQHESNGATFLVPSGSQGSEFQWNTLFSTQNLPTGFSRAAPGSAQANAALRIHEV